MKVVTFIFVVIGVDYNYFFPFFVGGEQTEDTKR